MKFYATINSYGMEKWQQIIFPKQHAHYNRYRRQESVENTTEKDEEHGWIKDEFFYSLWLFPIFSA